MSIQTQVAFSVQILDINLVILSHQIQFSSHVKLLQMHALNYCQITILGILSYRTTKIIVWHFGICK